MTSRINLTQSQGGRSSRRARVKSVWFFDGAFGTSFDVLYRNFPDGSSWVDNYSKLASFYLIHH